MTISEVAIRRPVFTAMMSVALVVLGVLGYARLGTDLYPDVTFPFVTIRTVYPGASPEDVEESVTRPIEDAVSSIAGVDRVTSYSRENVSFVFVEFELSVSLAEGVQNVRDKVGVAQGELPVGAEQPVISQYDLAAQPVLVFSASSGTDPVGLREVLEDRVRPALEQLDGVAAIRIQGGGEPEIAVDLFPERLRALGLSPGAVFERLRAEHLDLPGGRYPAGQGEVGVRVMGEFEGVDAIRAMPVSTAGDGSIVRLADVALVRNGTKEPRTLVRTNGVDAVSVEVVKQAGANTAKVAAAVKAFLPGLEAQHGFRAQVLVDQATTIAANAHEVWVAIFFGGAMAILIILLFLLDLRGTFISALALPTSVIGTLFAMYAMGFSLNQLTLLGLSLAIGLLIDDAVVVRESITRRLEAGDLPARAASRGTREIALAVMATTFTLVAVFVPVAFMQGITGQFFRQFGLTIAVAVLISLFIAFTLDPMLSARLARARPPGADTHGHVNPLARRIQAGFDGLDAAYASALGWVLRHRVGTAALALLLFVASLAVGGSLGSEFMPKEDRNQLIVNLEYPPGTRLATTSERSAALEDRVRALPGVTAVYAVVGPSEDARVSRWRVNLVDKAARPDPAERYKDRIRDILQSDRRLVNSAVSDPPTLEGLGDWPPILMQVVGPDFEVLRREARHLIETMSSIPAIADIQLKDSPGKPELKVVVDRDEAARLELPAGGVATQVRLATEGEIAGKVRVGRRESEIRVRLAGEDRESREALGRMWIQTPRGPVALAQLASLVSSTGPSVIEHVQRERQISVWAQIAPGHDLGSATAALREKVAGHALPPGYSYIWEGMQSEQAESQAAMVLALGIAVIFIYIVLASQFESFLHPATIMLSLPLAVVGALLGLGALRMTINLGSLIGLILLMGLVTKNAILLVDGALQRVRSGDPPDEAMRRAGPRRLRPILMTSAAMTLGMLPTALGRGMGSEFRSPMAVAVIGGVVTSTLLTLLVVPVVFVWVERLRGRRTALAGLDEPFDADAGALRERPASGREAAHARAERV